MEKGKGASAIKRPERVRDFTDLELWQVARRLRKAIFELTSTFPPEEKYGLLTQMRRAASSVTANIAEGYGRYSYRENVQFCRHSRGSVYELRDHLTSAFDTRYVSREKCRELNAMAMSVIRLLDGYIRSTLQLQKAADD